MITTIICICIILTILVATFFVCSIPKLQTTYHTIESGKVDEEIKLVVLSDLHSSSYGDNQEELVSAIKNQNPDLILMTGDMVDESRDRTPCTRLFNQIKTIAPIYFIHGNHEMPLTIRQNVTDYLSSFGVFVVFNTSIDVTVKNTTLRIFGLQDPQEKVAPDTWLNAISSFSSRVDEKFSILLSHRPTFVNEYKNTNFDLILCGHAHGGQWRLPWHEQGLYSPDEGLFPKYSSGKFELGTPTMLVSRGLCKNFIPRLFNRPEILSVTVK